MTYPYGGYGMGKPLSPYQQQMYQDRVNAYDQQQYANQYNGYMRGQQAFNQPQQMINCRPVSSYDEAKASMIDLDGSLFVFTDVANKKIYTKQIMLDGTAELKTYVLEDNQNKMQEQQAQQNNMYVLRTDFENVIKSMKQVDLPQVIPSDWSRYTTADVNDNVLPKFVRSAMQRYKDWEEQTKQLYEELWQQCTNYGMTADADYISKLVKNVTKEIKEINRMCEQLNGTGYDSVSIHSMQDKYHKKYKSKYEDEFTAKERKAMKENRTDN